MISIEIQLDQTQHALVVAEATRSGRTVDAVIAECVDGAFDEFRRDRLRAETRSHRFDHATDEPHRHVDHQDEEFLSPEDDA